jgi:hypothetical protein
MVETRDIRCAHANRLLEEIAAHGRHFFRHPKTGAISHFQLSDGRLWFHDYYGRVIYMHQPGNGRWRGFSEGGTLRALVQDLKHYIWNNTPLPTSHLGPWPQWYCEGDPWEYGDAMDRIRQRARTLGILREEPHAHIHSG